MTELKPCPFCGGNASLTHYRDSIIVWVECCKCGSSTIHRKLNEQAIEAWNTRAECGTLVRCRDCENARIKYNTKGTLKTASCSWHGRCINPNGYCAWGKLVV